MIAEQEERINTALSFPDEARDVRALVTEDNLITHGWIRTRMELDPDQLRGQKSGPKQTKAPAGASGSTTTPAPSTRKRAATSSKKPAAPKTAVALSLPPSGEAEDEEEASETPEEPLMRKKRSRKEPAVAPEVTPSATPQDPGTTGTTLGDVPFSEAAR